MKNIEGIPLIPVTIVSIKKVYLHPALSFTIPIKICPNILPKLAIPSMIPDTVAIAFSLSFNDCYFPRSVSIAAITIVEPLSENPSKNINIDITTTSLLFHNVRANVINVAIVVPMRKTGDL